tara:strand:+ start:5603 stop:8146 length:2544 start_codon:yes stop_codon:yes gene_type:complete
MADTIARLIFEANTAQLKKANDELKKLAKESGKSTKAVTEQTTAEQKLAKAKSASDKVQAKIVAAKNKRETQAYAEQIKRDNASAVSAKKASDQRAKAAEKASEQVQIASQKSASAQQKAAEKATQAQAKEANKAAEAQKKAVVNAAKAQEKASAKAAARIRVLAKAEIAAYKEAEKLAAAARKAGKAVESQGKAADKVTKKNEKLAKAFQKASNTAAILTGPLGGVSGRLSFIATGLGRVNVGALAGAVAFAGLATATVLSVKHFAEFESQIFKLEAMLKATGGTVGLTSAELEQLANDIGMATLASAGDIREAQGILLTFGSITGKQFKETTALSQDLAAVMGVTAQSAAKTLGKALEDPINNLSSLSRAGVVFTDTEKEIIDALIRTNRGMEAQDFIISKLTKKVGGAGEGAGKGLAGAFDGLGEQVGLLKIAFAKESGAASFFEKTTKRFTLLAKSITDALNAADKANIKDPSGSTKGGSSFKSKVIDFVNPPSLADQKASIMSGAGTITSRSTMAPMTPEETAANESIIQTISDDTDLQMAATDNSDAPAKKKEEEVKPPPLPFADLPSTREANAEMMAMDLEILESKLANATLLDDFHTQFRDQKLEADQAAAVAEYEASILKAEQDTIFGEERKALAMEELIAKNEVIMNNHLLLEQEELRHKAKLGDIDAKAELERLKFSEMTGRQKLKTFSNQMNTALQSFGNNSKKMFKIQKAVGIANATINMFEGVNAGVRLGWPLAIPAVAYAIGTGMSSINSIRSQTVGGGGGGGAPSGGGASGSSAAISAPVQEAVSEAPQEAPQPINVTVDGSIDPSGARRIIEAINEATEDGLQINALVGS